MTLGPIILLRKPEAQNFDFKMYTYPVRLQAVYTQWLLHLLQRF